jgi:hypothetical protein
MVCRLLAAEVAEEGMRGPGPMRRRRIDARAVPRLQTLPPSSPDPGKAPPLPRYVFGPQQTRLKEFAAQHHPCQESGAKTPLSRGYQRCRLVASCIRRCVTRRTRCRHHPGHRRILKLPTLMRRREDVELRAASPAKRVYTAATPNTRPSACRRPSPGGSVRFCKAVVKKLANETVPSPDRTPPIGVGGRGGFP